MPKIIENIRRQLLDTAREQIVRHGYENTTHFIRQFKSIVGVSPTVYRNQNSQALH
jgi:AraC-like DNA-binding protein